VSKTIVIASGLCSAIRDHVLTAFPPKQYPTLQITAWGEGHYYIPCPDGQTFPDSDIWVKRHIAHITVPGDDSFAVWVEYVLCRYMAANPDVGMRLMSAPLEPRNAKWAAKWATLPPNWRQTGCSVKLPADAKPPAKTQPRRAEPPPRKRAQRTQRKPGKPKQAKRGVSVLDFFRRF
jgi:hypothetical protein